MAKRKKSSSRSKKTRSTGGAMTGMRSGFKGMLGGGKSKAKGEKDFVTVFMYILLVVGVILLLSRVL